jgi:Na+/proline symporter
MLAGFAAAYMSTVGTHLNWGASYLVGDIYKRFLRKGESEKHYIAVSRWTTVGLFLASIVVTLNLSTIEGAWRFLLALGSGTGLVLILRWYWWRINAWSEISAMLASMVVSVTSLALIKNPLPKTDPGYGAEEFRIQAIVMLLTVAITTVVWVAVTFLTKPVPDATLDAFYRRVRPGGPGWETVSRRLGFGREPIPGGAMSFVNWILGIILVYTALFGIGKIVFGQLWMGFALLDVAIVSFIFIMWSLKRQETE